MDDDIFSFSALVFEAQCFCIVTKKQGNYSGLFFSIDSYLSTKKLTPSPSLRKIALIFSVVWFFDTIFRKVTLPIRFVIPFDFCYLKLFCSGLAWFFA
jgi:hypothetical protein